LVFVPVVPIYRKITMRKNPVLEKFLNFAPRTRQLAILWLGQSGFLLKSSSAVLLIDPYLSDFAEQWTYGWPNEHIRMSAIPLQPKELHGINYVLCTHDHVDHIDPFTIPIIALRNSQTKFIVPRVARIRMLGLFVNEKNLHLLRGEDQLDLNEVSVHAIPAAHSNLTFDQENGYHFLSYIIKTGDLTIFHAGDSILYDKQVEYLRRFSIDLAFLPINGQQLPELAFEPNFSITEAIQLAGSIKARMVIPMHYDMYTLNTANIADFVEQAHGHINFKIAQIGMPFMLDL
jgi:L-ascorbate 6-phosphate lactonase